MDWTIDEDVEAVVRAIQTLMAECRNPTLPWLLARVRFPRGVCTAGRLRYVIRRGMKSGRLVGPGSGRSTGYRFRSPPVAAKGKAVTFDVSLVRPKGAPLSSVREELSSIFAVILRPKPGSLIFFGKTLQNVGAALSKSGIVLVASGRPPKVTFDEFGQDGLPLWWGVLVEDGWDRARRILAAEGWSARPSLSDIAWRMNPDLQGVLLLAQEFEARGLADVLLAEMVDGRLRLYGVNNERQ